MKRTKTQRKRTQVQPPAAEPDAPQDRTEIFEQAAFEDGEALHEAETDLGISEWIDPDTGDPAEDGVPRIEDH
jgi:hypothetical protein